jgi:hypothetical protein
MNLYTRGQDRAEYLKGDTWRCSSSPSGAHHWIITRKTICKYCHVEQQPPIIQTGKDNTASPAVDKPLVS